VYVFLNLNWITPYSVLTTVMQIFVKLLSFNKVTFFLFFFGFETSFILTEVNTFANLKLDAVLYKKNKT